MLKKRNSGFTLLELIIVVIVIGILASIALPRYIEVAEKGRVAEAKELLSAIRSSQVRYAAQYSAWAAALGALDITIPAGKYFNMATLDPGAATINSPTAVIAQATRNNFQRPNHIAVYTVNIAQDGTLSGTVPAYLL